MTNASDPVSAIDLRYDPAVDMGSLYLTGLRERGMVKTTRMWWDDELRCELGLKFDSQDRLIKIELFSTSGLLRPEVMDLAKPYPHR